MSAREGGGEKYEKNNTHSRRTLNRRDTHQKNKVHVLGSHILSLKIVTKTPNHILMLFAYGFFPPSLHLLRMCFFLIQTVCVTMHVYPYLLPSIRRRGFGIIGGAGGALRGDGFVRVTA